MDKRIMYTNTDGGISIIIPSPDSDLTIEQIAAKDVPPNTDYKIVDVSELPQDREFRSAWENNDEKIEINFDKAKKITKQRLREERKPLLAAQDVEYLKALEVNGDTTEIIKEKKRLRDITKLADEATTLDELKELTAEKPKPPEPIIPVEPVVPVEPVEPIIPTPTNPGISSFQNMIVRID
jgi:hypothetical protein